MMYKKLIFFSKGSHWNQIICAILINLPVVGYGASMGWMSPMLLLLQSKNSPRGEPVTDTEAGWIASIAFLSAAIVPYVVARTGDKIGRKYTLISVSCFGTISWILLLCSLDTWAIISARAFVGVTMVGSYLTCPVYTKEISSDRIRGALGCLTMVFHTSGNLFLYVIGDLLDYRTVLWICLAIPLVHVVLFTMMPESPSYLVKNGKLEEANDVLLWLRCKREIDSSIQEELNRIVAEQKNDESTNQLVCKAIWNDRIMRKAFVIVLVVFFARDFCGSITFLQFAGEIFSISSQGTGMVLSPNQQAMMLGCVHFIASTLAMITIEKAGRKALYIGTACLSGLSMLVLASWFVAREYQITLSSWIPVITLCICIFCDSAGLLPVSSVLSSELFSFKYRSTVLSITLGVVHLLDFLQLIFFKPIVNTLGISVIFYTFAIVCLSSAVYVIIVLPETKGRSLDHIYTDLDKKSRSKCSML